VIKFTMDMKALKEAVTCARFALGTSGGDLSSQLFRLAVAGDILSIFAANQEMFVRVESKVSLGEGSEDGSWAVLGDKLVKLVGQVESERVGIAVEGENMMCRTGFLTVYFDTYDDDSLESIETGALGADWGDELWTDRGVLAEALEVAKSNTTTAALRPEVNHAELRDGRMLSSDGRKIMVFTYDGFDSKMGLKVPAGILTNVSRALKNATEEKVSISEGGSFYMIATKKRVKIFGVRKTERDFPAVESQISDASDPDDKIVVDKNVLEGMLRGVALGLPSDEVKVTVSLQGEGKESILQVSSKNSTGKKSHEQTSVGREATENIDFPVSFRHLLETLGVFKGDSVVDAYVYLDLNLLMIRDHTEQREVLTVIPFRTQEQVEEEEKERQAEEELKAGQDIDEDELEELGDLAAELGEELDELGDETEPEETVEEPIEEGVEA